MKDISNGTLMVCGILIFTFISVVSCIQKEDPVEPETSEPKAKQIVVQAGQMEGTDDLAHLKHLASGVGWDFSPNARTSTELKRIGIKTIRCINIDPLPGVFAPDGSFVMGVPTRLNQSLNTCREVGATPHLCIAINLPTALRATEEDIPEDQRGLLGNEMKKNVYGPTDWVKLRSHYKTLFKYVLLDQNFPEARFEVGNEPDIGGSIFVPLPPKPAMGSAAAYDAYLKLYRNVAQAATEFEQEHPGLKVRLGGPALGVFTFRFGAFNWSERFIKDVSEQKLKCDFFGLHFYGNISSQNDEFQAGYPSFTKMLKIVKAACALYNPDLPLWITEWGPSYKTNNSLPSRINADHMGAAWSAAFLSTMLRERINGALFLVTTDNLGLGTNGIPENVWGWPSMFVNPSSFGGNAYPKALFHVFDMVSRLSGQRVSVEAPEKFPGVFSSVDVDAGTVKVLLWNYDAMIPEFDPPTDRSTIQSINLLIKGLPKAMTDKSLTVRLWRVSEAEGNAVMLNAKGVPLTVGNTSLPLVVEVHAQSKGAEVSYSLNIPPSGVCLVEFSVDRTK